MVHHLYVGPTSSTRTSLGASESLWHPAVGHLRLVFAASQTGNPKTPLRRWSGFTQLFGPMRFNLAPVAHCLADPVLGPERGGRRRAGKSASMDPAAPDRA
jgi:hypothetical protein